MKLTRREAKVRMLAILTFLVCVALPMFSLAQAGFETAEGGAGSETGVTDVPVNGGTAFLIAGGVLFGVYRLYKVAQAKTRLSVN